MINLVRFVVGFLIGVVLLYACTASAKPAPTIETYPDTEPGSKLVLHMSTDSVRVVDTGDGPGFVVAVVIADADSATPLFLGVKAKDCAKPDGVGRPMYAFLDAELSRVAGALVWGNDPDAVWTKVGSRICELGATSPAKTAPPPAQDGKVHNGTRGG